MSARPRWNEPLRLVHHHPGYLRARARAFVDATEESPAVMAARSVAQSTAGFRSWSHRAVTGSIVIRYRPGAVEPDALLERIASEVGLDGLEHDLTDKVHRAELVDALLDGVEALNRLAAEATGGRADLRELLPAGLGAVSIISFALNAGDGRLPRWDNALWWCYRLFEGWHAGEIAARQERAAGRVTH
jgi:Heavy metal associated domain 2